MFIVPRTMLNRLVLSGAVLGTLFATQGTAQAATSVFDGANRLVSTTEGPTTVTYAYDGLGNLAKRCVNGTCTDLVLDDSSSLAQVVGEAPAGAATATTYAYGPAGVAAQRGTTPSYPLTDSLGTVRGLADAAGGIAGRRATDAFGATRSAVGAVSGIGYAGEFTGAEDGKVWLRARSYDPKIGRFDQRDTFAGFAERGASLNRYSYAEGNPIANTDPSGHAIPLIPILAGAISLASFWLAGANPANAPTSRQDAMCAKGDNNLALTMLGEGATQLVAGALMKSVLAGARTLGGWAPGRIGEALRTPVSKLFPDGSVPRPIPSPTQSIAPPSAPSARPGRGLTQSELDDFLARHNDYARGNSQNGIGGFVPKVADDAFIVQRSGSGEVVALAYPERVSANSFGSHPDAIKLTGVASSQSGAGSALVAKILNSVPKANGVIVEPAGQVSSWWAHQAGKHGARELQPGQYFFPGKK